MLVQPCVWLSARRAGAGAGRLVLRPFLIFFLEEEEALLLFQEQRSRWRFRKEPAKLYPIVVLFGSLAPVHCSTVPISVCILRWTVDVHGDAFV